MEDLKTLEAAQTVEELKLTQKAIEEVKRIIKENDISDTYGLRVGVKGGGCSGLSYTLGFDSEQKNGDNIIQFDGIKLFIDWKSILYLKGTEIDFSDGLMGKGFTFSNPNAKRTCGCGSSFGV